MRSHNFVGASLISMGLLASYSVRAQSATGAADETTQLEEVVVTAEKRSERAQDVPMSITAVTAEQLQKQGVVSVSDLTKIVPGFSFQPSDYGTPIYTIRGIGFKDVAVAVAPTVSVYVDQVPLPYSAMTSGAAFDLDRLEVLKGPQGTLFGQNSTGGAMNFIAAKPTDHLEAGVDATYGRFNEADAQGFLSGPLSDTVSARLAVRTEQRDAWQQSETRDATLGVRNFSTARLLLDWKPRDDLRFEFNANGWLDRSDTQAAQFVEFAPTVPGGYQDLAPALSAYVPARNDPRMADWDPNTNFRRDDRFHQFSLRGDWDMTDAITLTSITAWSDFKQYAPVDSDGTDLDNFLLTIRAAIQSFSQELRLAGATPDKRLRWMVGASYQDDKTRDDQEGTYTASNSGIGAFRYHDFINSNHQKIDTKAAFGSLDFNMTDTWSAQTSVRYTKYENHFLGCLFDTGDGELATAFSSIASAPIAPGACVTLDPATFAAVPIVSKDLDESNVSWRAGLNWKPSSEALYYVNATKGFKAGSFPTVPGLFPNQFDPIKQESVLAYELGTKQTLLSHSLQVDAAAFYYDYKDKQLIGYITTAFGNLPGLVSIPKSRVVGGELNVTWKPISSLTVTAGGTYVDSRVTDNFTTNDPLNNQINIQGEAFPNTPRWLFTSDIEYDFHLTNGIAAYVGASDSYKGSSYAAFGEVPLYTLHSYSLLDLRTGINAGNWRVELWGHNVTNKFYAQTVTHVVDTVARVAGMPATYGITVGYRMK
jgi:outer membrane receptor protein involved in Fe transport